MLQNNLLETCYEVKTGPKFSVTPQCDRRLNFPRAGIAQSPQRLTIGIAHARRRCVAAHAALCDGELVSDHVRDTAVSTDLPASR